MSDSMDLLFKIKADKEDASKKLEEVQGDVRKFRQEIINLTEELAKEKKLNVNTEKIAELEGKLKNANTAMSESKKVMGLLRDEANALAEDEKKAADGLKDFANIENLKNVAQAFSQIGEQAKELGKTLISEAEEGKHFEQEIRNLSTSTKEAEQSLTEMKQFSDNNKILDDEDVLKVGAELIKFKLNIKDTLPLLAQFAEAHQENITVPADVVIKSLSGMRGGLQQLASQYGATKEILTEYGAAVLASGELDKDAAETKQAVIAWMKDQKGEYTELTKSTMEYERSVGDLREAVGEQLIPMQIELNKKLIEGIEYFNSWSDSSKKAAISIAGLSVAGLAIGGTLAGVALSMASVVASSVSLITAIGGTTGLTNLFVVGRSAILGYTQALVTWAEGITASILGLGAFTLTLGAVAVAAAVAGAAIVKMNADMENLKNQDYIDGLQDSAKALQDLKKWYPEVTSATEAYGLMQQKGIENILKEKDGHEQVKEVIKSLALEQRKLEDQRTEHQKLAIEYAKDTSEEGKKKLADQIAIISYLNETIVKLKGEKDEANEATKAYDAKANAANGGSLSIGGAVTDTQLSDEIKRQNLLTETKKQSYDEQKRKIQAQAAELDAEGKTTEAKKKLLEIQEKDMRDKNLTEVEINEWKNSEIAKIDVEAAKKKDKLDQEKLAKTIEIEKQIVELRVKNAEKEVEIEKSNIEIKKLAALKTGQDKISIEQQYQRDLHALELRSIDNFKETEAEKTKAALLELDKKKVEWQKSGIDQVTIEKNVAQQLKNIQSDVTSDFLNKEKEKRQAIQDTYDAIQEIDKKLAANKEAQANLDSSMSSTGGTSPLQTMEQAFGKADSKGYTDSLVSQWEEQKKLKDEENSLLSQKLKLESDLISQNKELIKLKDIEAQATKSLASSLDNASGSISNFSNSLANFNPSGSNTSPGNNQSSGNNTSTDTDTTSPGDKNSTFSDNDKKGLGDFFSFVSDFQKSQTGGNKGSGSMGNMPGSGQGLGGNLPSAAFDDPVNDNAGIALGEDISKSILKNYSDMLKNVFAGSVKGLQSFANNITNVNSSQSQTQNTNYYMGGFNVNNAPDNVKQGAKDTVSWAMMQKYVKR